MHMADALLSPAVGGAVWLAAGAVTAASARRTGAQVDRSRVPLMGVLGAFVFAAQMVNFAIPGTGSSGHLGGGVLLAVLLGPEAAVVVIASVLLVQALFFADGGLLALGCNLLNIGVVPAFVAYPLFKRVVGRSWSRGRVLAGSLISAEVALLAGAAAVVFETTFSGISALPLPLFAAAMLPIHAAIGVVEGLVTAAIVMFVRRAQPELLTDVGAGRSSASGSPVLRAFAAAAVVTGLGLCWFASTRPDGLEWSISAVAGAEPDASGSGGTAHRLAASLQSVTAILPDYGFRARAGAEPAGVTWGKPDAATSVSGALGGVITLVLVGATGLALSRKRKRARSPEPRVRTLESRGNAG